MYGYTAKLGFGSADHMVILKNKMYFDSRKKAIENMLSRISRNLSNSGVAYDANDGETILVQMEEFGHFFAIGKFTISQMQMPQVISLSAPAAGYIGK